MRCNSPNNHRTILLLSNPNSHHTNLNLPKKRGLPLSKVNGVSRDKLLSSQEQNSLSQPTPCSLLMPSVKVKDSLELKGIVGHSTDACKMDRKVLSNMTSSVLLEQYGMKKVIHVTMRGQCQGQIAVKV